MRKLAVAVIAGAFAAVVAAAPALATTNVTLANDGGSALLMEQGHGSQYIAQALSSTTFSTTGNTMTSGGFTWYQWKDNSGQCVGDSSGDIIEATCNTSSVYEYFRFVGDPTGANGAPWLNLGNNCYVITSSGGLNQDTTCGPSTGSYTAAQKNWFQS